MAATSDRFNLVHQALANDLPNAYARPLNQAQNDALRQMQGERLKNTAEEHAATAQIHRRGASERFLPTYGFGGRLGPSANNYQASSHQRGQEMRVVDRPTVSSLREERQLRAGSTVFAVRYKDDIYARASDLPLVGGRGVEQVYVGPDKENHCSVVVAALPANQEFLLIYGPTDGSQAPRKVKFMGQHTVDGLETKSYTFLVGAEAPATDRLIDPRTRSVQRETSPYGLGCKAAGVRPLTARGLGTRKLA